MRVTTVAQITEAARVAANTVYTSVGVEPPLLAAIYGRRHRQGRRSAFMFRSDDGQTILTDPRRS
jgi:hypothetical protein